jgi:hypothetical protein
MEAVLIETWTGAKVKKILSAALTGRLVIKAEATANTKGRNQGLRW